MLHRLTSTVVALTLLSISITIQEVFAGNRYFQTDSYQYQQYSLWSTYCGPSTCVNVLPSLNLAPGQVNPAYQNYPEVQRYWQVPSSSGQATPTAASGTVLSNLELYKLGKTSGYTPSYSPMPTYKPQYTPSNQSQSGSSAPLSNLELYKRSSQGH
jgi:hypothetical protein